MITKNMKGQICLLEEKQIRKVDKTNNFILRERIESYGIDGLMDAEVLSLLSGISFEIVKKALDDFGILDLVKYLNSLNLTKTQRIKLELLNLYHKRMLTSRYKEKLVLNSSSKACEFALNLFTDKAYEAFFVICLDSQNRVNYADVVHEGTLNEAPVYPRMIVETALKYLANSVILAHNHPGGSLQPSTADLEVTRRITTALEAISIKIVDHIIVAEGKTTSFAEKGLI